MPQGAHGKTYRRNRARLLEDSTICWLCGHPGADTADHVTPISKGGSVTDPANMRPAHGINGCETCGQRCNQKRGNRNTFIPLNTSRRW